MTDFKDLMNELSLEKFNKLNFHVNVPSKDRVEFNKAKNYLLEIQGFMKNKDCIILKNTSIKDDFSYMYYADTLIFGHGTLAWWAGFLGYQKSVYVFENWRPIKGKKNKRLSNINDSRWKLW